MQVICLELWIYCFLEMCSIIWLIINFMKVLYLQGFSVLSNMIVLFNYGYNFYLVFILVEHDVKRAWIMRTMNHQHTTVMSDVNIKPSLTTGFLLVGWAVKHISMHIFPSRQTLGVLAINFLHPIYPFNSHECQNFILQYQHRIKQTSDENQEKCPQGDY